MSTISRVSSAQTQPLVPAFAQSVPQAALPSTASSLQRAELPPANSSANFDFKKLFGDLKGFTLRITEKEIYQVSWDEPDMHQVYLIRKLDEYAYKAVESKNYISWKFTPENFEKFATDYGDYLSGTDMSFLDSQSRPLTEESCDNFFKELRCSAKTANPCQFTLERYVAIPSGQGWDKWIKPICEHFNFAKNGINWMIPERSVASFRQELRKKIQFEVVNQPKPKPGQPKRSVSFTLEESLSAMILAEQDDDSSSEASFTEDSLSAISGPNGESLSEITCLEEESLNTISVDEQYEKNLNEKNLNEKNLNEKNLNERSLEARSSMVESFSWQKAGKGYSLQFKPRLLSAGSYDQALLAALLNFRAPTKQSSHGLEWNWSLEELEEYFNKPVNEKLNSDWELNYPQFFVNPKATWLSYNTDYYYSFKDLFNKVPDFSVIINSMIPGNQGKVTYYILWKGTNENRIEVKEIREILNKFADSQEQNKQLFWEFSAGQVGNFLSAYYEYSRQQKPPLFELRCKPVTYPYCQEAFAQVAAKRQLPPLVFDLYQEHLAIPRQQAGWDAVFEACSMVSLGEQWIVKKEHIREFFENLRQPKASVTLQVEQLSPGNEAALMQRLQKQNPVLQHLAILPQAEDILIFFDFDADDLPILQSARAAGIGELAECMSFTAKHRQSLRLKPAELAAFTRLCNAS